MTIDPRIINDGIGAASYAEIFWTLVGAICVLVILFELYDSIMDFVALKGLADYVARGQRHIIATKNIRDLSFDFLLFSGFVWIGVSAMISAPPTKTPSPYAVAVPLFSIAVELLFAAKVVLNRRDRLRLLHIVRKGRRKTDEHPAQTVQLDTKGELSYTDVNGTQKARE